MSNDENESECDENVKNVKSNTKKVETIEQHQQQQEEDLSTVVEKKWNNFLESLGNCLGGGKSGNMTVRFD